MMRCNKLKKEPGCSWIEVKDEVHAFLVGEKAHPRSKEIYEMLGMLVDEMRCYVADIDLLLEEIELLSRGTKSSTLFLPCNESKCAVSDFWETPYQGEGMERKM
ncbi:hypothetical protein V6N13_079941 [Hibiscus sabdariffa]